MVKERNGDDGSVTSRGSLCGAAVIARRRECFGWAIYELFANKLAGEHGIAGREGAG